ncbi:unnamed protein product [Boreogadus saida]
MLGVGQSRAPLSHSCLSSHLHLLPRLLPHSPTAISTFSLTSILTLTPTAICTSIHTTRPFTVHSAPGTSLEAGRYVGSPT